VNDASLQSLLERAVALQRGGQLAEAEHLYETVLARDPENADALNLLGVVDTSVAHVAGALGVNVWTPLPEPADFRGLTGREHSPWYPTMRLFRQKRAGDWDDVLKRVAGELVRLSGSRSE
jgi:hypothetical protein